MFKILNGYENIDSNIFFEIKESKITRGHNYTLVKKQSRLDVSIYVNPERSFGGTNGEPPSEESELRKGGPGVHPRKI